MLEGGTKTKIRLSFIMLGVTVIVVVVSYVYGVWAASKKEQEMVPRLAAESLVKGLRQFNRQNGRFPEDLAELEAKVWKHNAAPDFGPTKSTLSVANYYYVYARVDAQTGSVWAIPSGPKREEGATHFFVI